MPRFRVPTDAGVFEVETETEDPTEDELLALVEGGGEGGSGASAEEEPSILRKGAAFAARVGGPIVGGIAGGLATTPSILGVPAGVIGGAAAGGAAGELLAEQILGEEVDPTEIALSAGLAAVPAGPFARAAKPGIGVARRALLTAGEGAAQGALAAEAESIVREGELASAEDVARAVAGGAVLGGGIGAVTGRAARPALSPDVPLSPQTAAAEAAQEAKGLFRRVPGLAGDVPPRSPIPDDRLDELIDDVDVKFPHLGEVERLALKSTIAEQGDDILEHSRSVQSHERTDALAEELSLDLSKPLPKGTALNAEQMRHVVNLVAPLQERVTALAGEVASRPNDDVLKLKLQHASTRLTNTILSYSGARAEAGRTLNILRQQAKALAVGDAKSILAAQRLGISADDIAKVIAASPNDPVSQYKQLRDMYRPDWKDKIKWYYYTNILSGPQTHARNLVSNVINLSLRPATAPFAAAADVVGAKLGGREREVFAGEAPVQFLQVFRAMPEAWNKSLFMFKNGFSLSDVQDFEVRAPEMPGGIATNVVSRALAATDEFFRSLGFNMEMHAGAFARARKQATQEGLKGTALRERTADLTAEILDTKPQDLMEQADRFSRRVTFQETDNGVAKAFANLRDVVPGGSFILPFIRTPANIFRQGLHFSPAGFLMKGAGGGRAGQQRMGEAALGTALLTPVAWLAATGQITGAAPTDPGERDAFYAEGKRPNSIRIGDQWVSYTELGPLVLPFAVMANAADAWRKTGGELSTETAGTIIGQIGRSTLEQSYLTSLSAVFQALEDPQRYGQAFLQNLASGLIPAVGLQRNITRATDPNVRQATTFEEGLERNIPGLSQKLLPKLDALGQPVERPTGAGALVVPQVSAARVDPIREELKAAGVSLDPLKRQKSITVGEEKVALSPEADFAIRKATGAFRVILLRDLFASPEYQGATTEEKASAIQQTIRQAGSAAAEGARNLIREEQPVTFEALTEGLEDPEVVEQRAPEAPSGDIPLGGPPTDLDPIFKRAAEVTGIDPTFIKAAAKVESDFDPNAVGPMTRWGKAIGPMQILPSTFRLFESRARRILGREPVITNPADNILVGALYYLDLLDQTGDDPEAAARLYHGGPNLREHGPKTKAYGKKVAETYARFIGGQA